MLLKRPDIRKGMIKLGARLSIIGKNEKQIDLPECKDWKKPTLEDPRLTPLERDNYFKPGGIASKTDRGYRISVLGVWVEFKPLVRKKIY